MIRRAASADTRPQSDASGELLVMLGTIVQASGRLRRSSKTRDRRNPQRTIPK